MSIIQGTSKAAGGAGYEIDQSIRFNADDSAYLEKTYASSESTLTAWSFSAWIKRSKLGAEQWLFAAGTASSNLEYLRFTSGDKLEYKLLISSSLDSNYITSQLFRDPSAWMHIYAYRSSTTFKLYINGSEVIDFSTSNAPGSSDGQFGKNYRHRIGTSYSTPANFLGAYLAEMNFVPGTAKAVTDFGEYNDDGVWIPKAYDGSYGSNGFYITGETASDLGEDFSGNNNDFTSSGLATTDQMLDTPTDNYCTLSPIDKSSAITTSDGNLVVRNASTNSWNHGRGTLFAPSGKWYYEWIPTAGSYAEAGWMLNVSGNDYVEEESDVATTFYRGVGAAGHGFRIGSSATDSAVTNFSLNDVIMMAIDVDTMKMWVGINGTWYNSGDPAGGTNPVGTWTDAIGQSVAPWYGCFNGTTESFNFGQRPFAHTIPTGFNSWNTANLATPSITDGSAHFQPTLYTGNGTAIGSGGLEVNQSGNSTFQPDLVWIKSRSNALSHFLTDVVRGATNYISSNNNAVEGSTSEGLVSFDSDGFTVGSSGGVNTNSATYVGWQWKANGAGSSNTDGSITSTVSANTTAGFSTIRWSGTAANGTIGHGLGIQPSLYIVKNTATTRNWLVGSTLYSNATQYLLLNTTDAINTAPTVWNSAYPTSSVINLGSSPTSNGSGTNNMICYAFAEIPGYSSIGSYTGNGSADGPFVYTGFKVKWIMFRTTSAGRWYMLDVDRASVPNANVVNTQFFAELTNAESAPDVGSATDFLSNGFKVRNTGINGSGQTITYMAFAENPFGGDGVAPATAR